MDASMIGGLELFFCYAHEDKSLRDELDAHLAILKHQRCITSWYDGKIVPGEDWEREIAVHLEAADIILLLVSSDFLASSQHYDVEMKQALDRHSAGTAHVIPIIVRAVHWNDAPFSKLQVLPTDAQAVTSWQNRDEAWRDVVAGIQMTIRGLQAPLQLVQNVATLPEKFQIRGTKPQTLGEFLRLFVGLQTNLDKILVFGYWYEIKQGQPYFTQEDILAKFKEVRKISPSNISRDLASLVAKGLLLPLGRSDDGRSIYALSNSGIREVELKMLQPELGARRLL